MKTMLRLTCNKCGEDLYLFRDKKADDLADEIIGVAEAHECGI